VKYSFDEFMERYKEQRANGKDKTKAATDILELMAFGNFAKSG